MYDISLVIGRFQPLHDGHIALIKKAMNLAETTVVCIGSKNLSRSVKNPLSFLERSEIVRTVFPEVEIIGVCDHASDKTWVNELSFKIYEKKSELSADTVVLVAGEKDRDLYKSIGIPFYMKFFEYSFPSGTDIRSSIFRYNDFREVPSIVRDKVISFWPNELREEFEDIERSKKEMGNYPPTNVTSDIIVETDGGFILLIERGNNPGKMLMALPGGFVEASEKVVDCAARELEEEMSIVANKKDFFFVGTYDSPGRDPRGRVITHVFYHRLRGEYTVKAGSDAKKIVEIPIHKIGMLQNHFFLDHGLILADYFYNKSGMAL